MVQQKTTVEHLWQLVASGGILVTEDLSTSYSPEFGRGPKGHAGTIIEKHKDMSDNLHCEFQEECNRIPPNLLNLDCYRKACVMVKESTA